jgi:hypothetical protein
LLILLLLLVLLLVLPRLLNPLVLVLQLHNSMPSFAASSPAAGRGSSAC